MKWNDPKRWDDIARDEDGFLLWLIVIGGALIALGILITLLRAGGL